MSNNKGLIIKNKTLNHFDHNLIKINLDQKRRTQQRNQNLTANQKNRKAKLELNKETSIQQQNQNTTMNLDTNNELRTQQRN